MSDTEATGSAGATQTFDAVETALARATMYALTQGDRYTQMRRKSTANAFYSALPLLSEVRRVYRAGAVLPRWPAGWRIGPTADGELIVSGPNGGLIVKAEEKRLERRMLFDLATMLLDSTAKCATCEPEGVFATDGTGPYDCYACGKRAAIAPAGMVLVPRKLTEAQHLAYWNEDSDDHSEPVTSDKITNGDRARLQSTWEVLLAAAPAAQVAEGWDKRGGPIWLDRNQWGVVVDALIEHKRSAELRKDTNPASTSDERADLCDALIAVINAAAAWPVSAAAPAVVVDEALYSAEEVAEAMEVLRGRNGSSAMTDDALAEMERVLLAAALNQGKANG